LWDITVMELKSTYRVRELNKENKLLCGKIADQFHELWSGLALFFWCFTE